LNEKKGGGRPTFVIIYEGVIKWLGLVELPFFVKAKTPTERGFFMTCKMNGCTMSDLFN